MNAATAEIVATVRQVLGMTEKQTISISPITRGGSARSFSRVRCDDRTSVIFMHYDHDRRENNYYAAQAEFLRGIGVSVPRIFHHDAVKGIIVMEDLGERDLWHYRQAGWDLRRRYYSQTLDMIGKLHARRPGDAALAGIPLMEAFGPDLYRWEREYFQQHFVRGVCRIELDTAEAVALEAELTELAADLAGMESCLIHRDLQSQNVLISDRGPVLIDFQGMRYGHPCYDLGSLLYDPYVVFTSGERGELLQYYHRHYKNEYDFTQFQAMFQQASVQRLMQALGAYGYLGRERNQPEFLAHIPSGLTNLLEAAGHNSRLQQLQNLALRCRKSLNQARTDP